LRDEDHSAAGWDIGGSDDLQTAGPKFVHSGSGLLLIAPRHLLPVLVSTPLRTVNRICSGFLVSGGI